MGIICLKYKDDKKNFKVLKSFGLEVLDIDNLEKTDSIIEDLVNKNYNTIIISKDVSNFSQDIVTKYIKNSKINIIISRK